MSDTYPNARDCEHGHQRGKCPECRVVELETELAEARVCLCLALDNALDWDSMVTGDDLRRWSKAAGRMT